MTLKTKIIATQTLTQIQTTLTILIITKTTQTRTLMMIKIMINIMIKIIATITAIMIADKVVEINTPIRPTQHTQHNPPIQIKSLDLIPVRTEERTVSSLLTRVLPTSTSTT